MKLLSFSGVVHFCFKKLSGKNVFCNYSVDLQGYCNRVLEFFLVINFRNRKADCVGMVNFKECQFLKNTNEITFIFRCGPFLF